MFFKDPTVQLNTWSKWAMTKWEGKTFSTSYATSRMLFTRKKKKLTKPIWTYSHERHLFSFLWVFVETRGNVMKNLVLFDYYYYSTWELSLNFFFCWSQESQPSSLPPSPQILLLVTRRQQWRHDIKQPSEASV